MFPSLQTNFLDPMATWEEVTCESPYLGHLAVKHILYQVFDDINFAW